MIGSESTTFDNTSPILIVIRLKCPCGLHSMSSSRHHEGIVVVEVVYIEHLPWREGI